MGTNDDLRSRVKNSVPSDVELFEREGDVWGRDENDNEFKLDPMTGSPEPVDGRCGAVCVNTMDRYGETRYCTKMPESTFIEDGSDFCKTHKSREALMERAQELFKHGHFAVNYVTFAKRLSLPKFLFAVEMVGGLFEMSTLDFDLTSETRKLDASDEELIEEDVIDIDLPIPQNDSLSFQADQLWQAALAEVEINNMREVVFEDDMETERLADSADMEGKITDTKYEAQEHHLHLPISRLTKDIKEHLQNGGVSVEDDDSGVVTFQKNDYTLSVEPDEETAPADAQSQDEAVDDFAEYLTEDSGEVEVEAVENSAE